MATAKERRELALAVDRDSVAAGDDCASHVAALTIEASITVVELLAVARRACPLAGIIGGRATWIADAGGEGGAPFAVLAEQWREPKLLVAATTTAAALFADRPRMLYFRYWCQTDPDAVFAALRTGAPLPSRYG
jgi:hypothetical protein